jgi:nicotinamide phosphoribosyltransferase
VVSDTFDLFKVITEYLPRLKEEILARDGKLVIRPDSGNPVDILCGFIKNDEGLIYNSEENIRNGGSYYLEPKNTPEEIGVIELLWNVFGGTINEQGYKVLDSHIGAIYGDSITIDRADEICKRLEDKGFASTNVVLGIGSFTYQFNTRDTFGFAMKATYVELTQMVGVSVIGDGGVYDVPEIVGREIFKDPITDDGTKKSATGLLCVEELLDGGIGLYDRVSWNTENTGLLQTIYKDGEFHNQTTLTEIRARLK